MSARDAHDRSFAHALEVLEFERIREVIASYAASSLGRGIAQRMRPLESLDRARRALAETSELRDFLRTHRLPLQGLSDVVQTLEALSRDGRPAEPGALFEVVDLIRCGDSVVAALGRDPDFFPHLATMAEGLPDLSDLVEEIPRVVHPKDGVRDEASEKLASLRREAATLRNSLRERIGAIRRRPQLSKCLQADNTTVKNDRYLLPVKAEYRSWVRGPIRHRSHKGATLFIEPEEIVQSGDRLIDVVEAARREETKILWELTRSVLEREADIARVQRRLARVDFTYAKASLSAAFGLEAPALDDAGELDVRALRHPYLLWIERDARRDIHSPDLDALRERIVPIDVRLSGPRRILVITGPNTGGKTVALKTLGLSVLLALSGVPISAAPESRVPFYSGIFADIGDEQSIEQSLSTFSSHLRQIQSILESASENSLILLDELGSGTDPLEGAALGSALLDHFRERGWTAVITTHLGSLKQYAYQHDEVENAAMEFDERTLTPTYRLLLGVPGSSKALAIARRLGIESSIIERAEREIAEVEEPTREIISRMEKSRRGLERERRRAEKVRRRVQGDAREYRERLQEVDQRREALDREADDEVDRVVRDARERLRPFIKQLQNVPKTHREVVDALGEAVDGLLAATPLGERREAFARSLKKESEVYVPKLGAKGTVRKIHKGDRVVTVLIDGIPVEVGFDDVSWLDAES